MGGTHRAHATRSAPAHAPDELVPEQPTGWLPTNDLWTDAEESPETSPGNLYQPDPLTPLSGAHVTGRAAQTVNGLTADLFTRRVTWAIFLSCIVQWSFGQMPSK